MNIGIDIRALMNAKVSGVTVYIENLLQELFKLYPEDNYFLYYNNYHKVHLPEFKGKNVQMVKTGYPNKIFNLLLSIFFWPKIDRLIAKKIGQSIDVFFTPDLRPTALSKNVKKILTIHDLSFLKFPKNFSWRTRLWHKILKPFREIKQADTIIAISEFTKKEIISFCHVSADKIKVIYHGVSLETKSTANLSAEQIRKKYNLPDKFILTVSAIEPRKNLNSLIKAIDLLRKKSGFDYDLVIAGQENQRIFRMPRLDKRDYVHLRGFVSEAEKTVLYKVCNLFAFVSFYEGFGLPVLEAMKMGCPLVLAKGSAVEEVADGLAVMVDPYDVADMAKGMEMALLQGYESPLIEQARVRADSFTWKKTAEEVRDVLMTKS